MKSYNLFKPTITLDETVAISLQYDAKEMLAPKVTAKGTGFVAEQIIKIAKEHNIPLQSDKQLVDLLSQVEIDSQIPEVLYEAIAQVLIFAYQLSDKKNINNNSPVNL